MNLPDKYIERIRQFFASHNIPVNIRNHTIEGGSYKAEQCSVSVLRADNLSPIAHFELREMIGCCGIVVSTNCWINDAYKGQKFGSFLHELRIDIAKEWGYGLMLCTDIDSNEPQKKILKKYGWNPVEQFVNPRTSNTINIHTYYL